MLIQQIPANPQMRVEPNGSHLRLEDGIIAVPKMVIHYLGQECQVNATRYAPRESDNYIMLCRERATGALHLLPLAAPEDARGHGFDVFLAMAYRTGEDWTVTQLVTEAKR